MWPIRRDDSGFSLIEVMFGMLVLMVAVIGLAASVALGARRLTGTQDQLLASEHADEAAEPVFKARDIPALDLTPIRNLAGNCVNTRCITIH